MSSSLRARLERLEAIVNQRPLDVFGADRSDGRLSLREYRQEDGESDDAFVERVREAISHCVVLTPEDVGL